MDVIGFPYPVSPLIPNSPLPRLHLRFGQGHGSDLHIVLGGQEVSQAAKAETDLQEFHACHGIPFHWCGPILMIIGLIYFRIKVNHIKAILVA